MLSLLNLNFALLSFGVSRFPLINPEKSLKMIIIHERLHNFKAMREKEAAVGRKKYKYCLIRVRFPDGFILQVSLIHQEKTHK